MLLYLLTALLIIPTVAPFTGRVALPLSGQLRPLNYMTYLLNRQYVKPELESILLQIAKQDSLAILYLDANFPFIDGFPLIPHLSHNDGKKIDLSFHYLNIMNNQPTDKAPSLIGYGVCEAAKNGETDYAKICADKGYVQYGLLEKLMPQNRKSQFKVNEEGTARLIKRFSNNPQCDKIFLEPHLKKRWGLSHIDKIRFHGCHTVRHDDHIHLQMK